MEGLIDFFNSFISSFATFGDWFFNQSLTIGTWVVHPYSILLFSGLVIVLGLHIFKLVNPFS